MILQSTNKIKIICVTIQMKELTFCEKRYVCQYVAYMEKCRNSDK